MRVYDGCEKVVEMYPEWKLCDRPAKRIPGRPTRCELHPVKVIWATDEVEA